MPQHAAPEHREQDMRRLRLAVGIGHLPRHDGVEGVGAVGIGAAAGETAEPPLRQPAPPAGQPSSMQSGTGWPSPSNTRPSIRTRSPDVSGVTRLPVKASFQSYWPFGVRPYLKNGPTGRA